MKISVADAGEFDVDEKFVKVRFRDWYLLIKYRYYSLASGVLP
jgi:hypothetical protein